MTMIAKKKPFSPADELRAESGGDRVVAWNFKSENRQPDSPVTAMSPKTRSLSPVSVSRAAGTQREELPPGERERRRLAFQEFVSCVPRLCSPSSLVTSSPILPQTSPQSFDPDFQFNWSIDQIAALEPAQFSDELNASFYRLDECVDQGLREEDEQFFNQSRVLPSPDTQSGDARDGFTCLFSPRGHSVSKEGTPSRGFGDMSVSEAKVPTPINVSKTRQKKKKLFSDDDSLMSEAVTEYSDSESNSGMDCLRNESILRRLDTGIPELSPILGEGSRILEMGAEDDTFSQDSKSISVMVRSSCCVVDSRKKDTSTRSGLFTAFQTSTPTQRHT